MKIVPEQIITSIQRQTQPNSKLDRGAVCFFLLGIFIIAFTLHMLTFVS
ncbi:hypothetical protein SAMN05444584_0889 [Acinetobacter apis]|uniref:Uncharacterized protein n=1 Tax=Acinetobacter apis TaxID=1229165 RepID=A0A217EEN4_9GAMM|nr:hypothetical protein SAMN05444584_0889 [Acinetobacter apis]